MLTASSITMWYRRHECGFRMAIFFSAATAAGAFGGLLARGIMEMKGVAGLSGWQWIFIIEGLLTFVVAVIAYKVMQDYPATAKFLTQEEREEIQARLKLDRSSLSDEFNLKFFGDAIRDWKIWVHMFITIGIYTGLYSYSLFLPTIINDLGTAKTPQIAQLMTVPPYVVACILCVSGGWYADKMGQRGIFMIGFILLAYVSPVTSFSFFFSFFFFSFFFFLSFYPPERATTLNPANQCHSVIGLIMLMASDSSAVRYVGCFFLASGIYPNVPLGVAWNGNNIGGSLKRGVGVACHVGFGNLGGAISGYLFLAKHKPRYISGFSVLLGCQLMSLILSIGMTIYLRRENARRDREYKPPSEYTEAERLAESDKGDNATFFRYTI